MKTDYTNTVINLAFRFDEISQSEKEYSIKNYNEDNKSELIEVSTKKKILPVVGKFFKGLGVDADFWGKHYDYFKVRNQKVIDLVDSVFARLRDHGIEHIFAFENFGALLSSESDIALYSSGDVDLYADVRFKKRIEEVLAEFGYKPTRDIYEKRSIMTEFLKNDGIIRINIDWILLRRMSLPICIDEMSLVDWSEVRRYKNTSIRLPPKELLLYLCFLRIAVHGFSRSPDVRLYIDTINSTKGSPDWQVVLDWARKDNTLTKFISVAGIATQLNGIKIPDEVHQLIASDKNAQYIINQCFDSKTKSLIYEPNGLKLLRIEAAADNVSLFGEVMRMLFPSSAWLTQFYLSDNEFNIKKYINYYKRLLRL